MAPPPFRSSTGQTIPARGLRWLLTAAAVLVSSACTTTATGTGRRRVPVTSGLPGFMSFTSREQLSAWETAKMKRLAWVETTQGISNIFAAEDASGRARQPGLG